MARSKAQIQADIDEQKQNIINYKSIINRDSTSRMIAQMAIPACEERLHELEMELRAANK